MRFKTKVKKPIYYIRQDVDVNLLCFEDADSPILIELELDDYAFIHLRDMILGGKQS